MCNGSYKWIIMLKTAGTQISMFFPQMNNWHPCLHPWQLKKLKSCPFWSYQLNRTANSAFSPRNWAKRAELAVLFSWQLQNSPHFVILELLHNFVEKSLKFYCIALEKLYKNKVTKMVIKDKAKLSWISRIYPYNFHKCWALWQWSYLQGISCQIGKSNTALVRI